MAKFNLLTSLSVNASGMTAGLAEATSATKDFVAGSNAQAEKLSMAFRDIATMGISDMRKELMSLKNTKGWGDKTAEEIQAIKQRMGDLTDTMGDFRAELQVMGGPGIGAVISGLQFMSAGVEGVVGSLSLFGVESGVIKDMEKKMMSLIGVTQALGVIEDFVNSGKLRAIGLKLKDMAATVASTVATKAATIQLGAMNAVMLLNPVVLITAGVAALTAGLLFLAGAFSDTTTMIDKNSEAYKALLQVQKDLVGMTKDISTSNTDLMNKHLVATGKMTEKEYGLTKVLLDKETKLKNIDDIERKSIKTAQDNIQTTAGYMYTDMLKDQQKAREDANASRAAVIVEAYLQEQALGDIEQANLKKATKGLKDKTSALDEYMKRVHELAKLEGLIEITYKDMGASDVKGVASVNASGEKTGLQPKGITQQGNPAALGGVRAFSDVRAMTASYSKLIQQINDITKQGLASMAGSFSEGIADMITGDGGLGGFFSGMLDSLGQFLKQMGAAVVAYAITMDAFKKAFANPFVAIAAGIALMIAGGVVSNYSQKIGKGNFAGGGIVPGESFSGDKVYANVNSGEMILNSAQQARLFDMANGGGGGGQLTTRVSGSDLMIVLNNHGKKLRNTR